MSITQTAPDGIKHGDAPHYFMRINYCGGLGYRPKAIAAITEIEKEMPGVFTYYLIRGNGAT